MDKQRQQNINNMEIISEERKSLLDSKITEQSNLLRTDRLDVSFGELLSMYGECKLNCVKLQ